VADYLESLRQVVSTQVLIEAKIIEVSLKINIRAGLTGKKWEVALFMRDMDWAI